jgi:hypothetical protein
MGATGNATGPNETDSMAAGYGVAIPVDRQQAGDTARRSGKHVDGGLGGIRSRPGRGCA